MNSKDFLQQRLSVSDEVIQAFCQKHMITKLELFGSILREDFDTKSDIDVMVTFAPERSLNLFEFSDIHHELEHLFAHRHVDLVMRKAVEESTNPYRRDEILSSAEVYYAK